jgi:S-DNA-T family DNA segregation ATPase FtsK/SpoIIIE
MADVENQSSDLSERDSSTDTEPEPGHDAAQPVLVDQPGIEPAVSFVARLAARQWRPIIPVWLRSWSDLRAAVWHLVRFVAHVVGYHAIRGPLYGLRLLLRFPAGAWRCLRGFIRWLLDIEGHSVRVAMARDEDADHYLKLCRQRDRRVRFRATLTATASAVLAGMTVTAVTLLPLWVLALLLAAIVGALGWMGMPADKLLISRAVVPARVQRLTSDVIVRALSVLGIAGITQALTKNPQAIGFVAPIMRDGPGYRAEIDLPPGVTAADVIERRPKLASGLGRPLGCVWPEGQPDIHPGRLLLWVGYHDMSTTRQPSWPLATHGVADLFRPMPIGTDQRGRWVEVTLMFVSMIIGSVPRMGKTVLLRVILLLAALDPRTELYVFDLKGTGDLSALEKVAHHYRCGDEDPDITYILTAIRSLRQEMRRRAKVIRGLPKDICPDSKVTPQLATNATLGLHPVVAGVDECHRLFEHPTHGAELAELCEDLVRRGPAVGIIVVLATQRPDAKSIPTGMSANAVLRFCLKVMGYEANDMILGTGAYKAGIRATTFSFRDKGIGYLLGEGEEARIVRSPYIDGIAADRIATRARALREARGLLTGYATGHDTTTDDVTRADTLLPDILAIIPENIDKLWSEIVVDRLAALRPDIYRPWGQLESGTAKATQLAAALKPYGVATVQVWGTDPVTSVGANRRGVLRSNIARAHAQLQHDTPASNIET